MRPDPGRVTQEKLIAAMPPSRRSAIAARLREQGLQLVWQQAEAAGPMTELDRAMFILERLYPEMPAPHREQVRGQLADRWEAGTWRGFKRPDPLDT